MAADRENLTLHNLGNGGAIELFETELERVLENILDLNTDAKAKRKIVLTVTFTPNSDRNEVATDVDCASKLAPMNAASATVFVGRDRHTQIPRAVTHDPRQMEMFDDPRRPKPMREPEDEAATA